MPVEKQIEKARKITRNRLSTKKTQEMIRESGAGTYRRPTDELQKFRYFLKWTSVDSENMVARPKNYFLNMTKSRPNEEIAEMAQKVEEVIQNLTCIKETLDRIHDIRTRKAG
jgi:hypothetical protein